jgi:carbonic anhydrase
MLSNEIGMKERILLESEAWRIEKLNYNENYFRHLNRRNKPTMLWITSNDNLTSMSEITNAAPGEIMVYRNIGAQVRNDDLSVQAVLHEAVDVHRVSHIMICCYSNCTAIWDTILGTHNGPGMKEWLAQLHNLYERHYDELKNLPHKDQEKLLSEINIREQVIKVSKTDCVQKAWQEGTNPTICGWYFDVEMGSLKEVFSLEKSKSVHQKQRLFKMEQ